MKTLINVTVLLITLSIVMLLDWSMTSFMRAANTGEISQAIIIAAEKVKYTLVDAETGQRGYVVTGDPRYLEPYNTSVTEIDKQLAALRETLDQRTFKDSTAHSIAILVHQKMDELAQVITLRQDKGFEPAREFVARNIGKRTMDDVRSIVQNIQDTESNRMVAATGTVRQMAQIMTYSIIMLVVCMTFLGLLWDRQDETTMIDGTRFGKLRSLHWTSISINLLMLVILFVFTIAFFNFCH